MNECVLRPIDDRVVVTLDDPMTESPGGIVLPDVAQKDSQWGTVLRAGPGYHEPHTGELVPMDVKPGDRVLLPRYGGTDVTIGGVDYVLIAARELLAVDVPLGNYAGTGGEQ